MAPGRMQPKRRCSLSPGCAPGYSGGDLGGRAGRIRVHGGRPVSGVRLGQLDWCSTGTDPGLASVALASGSVTASCNSMTDGLAGEPGLVVATYAARLPRPEGHPHLPGEFGIPRPRG